MKPRHPSRSITRIVMVIWLLPAGCSAIDKTAHRKLMENIGHVSVTVYPTVIRQSAITYDWPSAEAIAAELVAKHWATSSVSGDRIAVASGWRMNQRRLFRESAQSLAEHVRAHKPRSDYGLMAEYLLGPREAGGIHCYVVDHEGRLAAGIGLNSHHKLFSDAAPRSVEDCTKVLLKALDAELSRHVKKEK